MERVASVRAALAASLEPLGFEVAPFLVGEYNKALALGSEAARFSIEAAPGTVAFCVLSTPHMWGAFEEWYRARAAAGEGLPRSDPVDSFANACIDAAAAALNKEAGSDEAESGATGGGGGGGGGGGAAAAPSAGGGGEGDEPAGKMHARVLSEGWDYARHQPFVLVQTAGHVAGMARFYQPKDVADTAALDAWQAERRAAGKSDRIFGVAVHARFGGWFAFRAVVVVDGLLWPDMPLVAPVDPLPTDEGRSVALIKFSEGWNDRELPLATPPEAEYPPAAKTYFGFMAPRADKLAVLARLADEGAAAAGAGAAGDSDGTGAASAALTPHGGEEAHA